MNPRTPTSPTVPADPEASAAAEASDAEETVTKKAAAEDVSYDMDKAAGEALTAADAEAEDDDLDPDDLDDDSAKEPSGLGAAAAAVAAAGLGVVALTGSWTGKVAAERETLIGQIKSSSGGTAAQQISEIYGDAWHSTALVNGLFALLALLAGIFALVRPAFGAPSAHPQPGWVRAVATAGIALGVLGLVLSIGMYFDLIVPLPTAG
ncbi:hypothetical protein OG520_11760 [Streptomyces sp. NBC_00984]|uniref:hypothetical protein n=1 Tax=Streptomyces sp. NBC_00984 TaxID=2903700 RepID=UPI00386A54E6|nr:hypothetical protein OG520_11760 [Streptomyces sp. NBC_00984]